MNLPLPSPKHVEKFKAIYREEFGVEITDEEAYDQCSRLFRYVYLTHYALPYLRSVKKDSVAKENDPIAGEGSSDLI